MTVLRCQRCSRPATEAGSGFHLCRKHWKEAEQKGELPAPRCDFCSSTDLIGAMDYGCEDYLRTQVGETTLASRGDWLACAACHEFIEAEDWDGLVQRQLACPHGRKIVKRGGVDFARDWLTKNLEQFREHRTGEKRPYMPSRPYGEWVDIKTGKYAQLDRKARLSFKDLFLVLDPIQQSVGELGEVWFMRKGMADEAVAWRDSLGQVELDDLRRRLEQEVPFDIPMLFAFEGSPRIGGIAVLQMRPVDGEQQAEAGSALYALYGPPPEDQSEDAEMFRLRLKALMAMALLCRVFAMNTEAMASRRVEVAVAEAIRPKRAPKVPLITVIRWRKTVTHQSEKEEYMHKDARWSHRWLVRAHLRHLKDGRITPVREHIKGPGDKPFVLKTRINVLDR